MGENLKSDLWNRLTFKTVNYSKNFDTIIKNENYITEHEGVITEVRIDDNKPPFIAGEYGFSVFNLKFSRLYNIDLNNVVEEYGDMDSYSELHKLIENNIINFKNIDRLILIHRFMLHSNYRKKEVFDEFIEYMFRDYVFNTNNKMLMLVKPIQLNHMDWDLYKRGKNIKVKHQIGKNSDYDMIPSYQYYGLDEFIKKEDDEFNEYKLFSIASRCGFVRLDDSYLFEFKEDKILRRFEKKNETYNKTINN